VWTFSIIFRNETPGFAENLPYVVALVELDEGNLKVMTNIINCHPDHVRIGMPVEVVFVTVDEHLILPMFQPTSAQR
jgi:uncharacterized OB-fold protein